MISEAKKLDQWFTKESVADMCVDKMYELGFIDKSSYVVEPSAGEGVFLHSIERYVDYEQVIGYDLDPKLPSIVENDWLKNRPDFHRKVVISGNPPYGKKAKLAIEFINASFEVADVVGFIVPITLSTSYTAQKNIDKNAALVFEMTLPKNSFTFEGKEVDVPSVFQIWQKRLPDIRLAKPQTEHDDLEIHIYNKMPTAEKWLTWDWDIAVKRNSKNGEYVVKGEVASVDSHWILIKGPIDNLTKIDWSKLNDNKMTAGMGKADVVKAYKGVMNDN